MTRTIDFSRRFTALIVAAVLFAALALPLVINNHQVQAAQVTSRKITMSTSKAGATSASYAVSFIPTQATAILSMVIDFCSNSPLIGLTCTAPGSMVTPSSSTITVSQTGATPSSVAFNVAGSGTGKVLLSHATGITTVSTVNPITFTITGITNPAATGTFYGRILTYTTQAAAGSYTATAPGTHLDDGGVALSTAAQLTISARVQETLTFCVGTTTVVNATSSVGANCGAISGTSVDLGPIGTSTSVSPISSANGGNGFNGVAMVQTNAYNGVNISYFAEQATSGSFHLGALRTTAASYSCTNDSVPSTSNTDACFNSVGTTQSTISAGQEKFGFTISAVNCGAVSAYTCTYSSGTYNLTRNAQYDGDGANTVGTSQGFAWDETGTAQTIASSSTVVDNEALIMNYAAQAAITTPTGSYGVTSTYVATATF